MRTPTIKQLSDAIANLPDFNKDGNDVYIVPTMLLDNAISIYANRYPTLPDLPKRFIFKKDYALRTWILFEIE